MANHVYPLGYSTPGAQERIEELLEKKTLIIDTRLKPWSHNVFWRKEELENVYGGRYRWAGKVLGNENYQGGPIKLVDPDTGIRGLTRYLNEGYDLILMCQCKTFSSCHLHTICNLLKESMPDVEVVRFEQEEMQQQLFDVPRTAPEQVEMSTSSIQEWCYSVSDVIFEDVGDAPVPDEYQALYDEYCAEVDWLPVQTPLWCALECHHGVYTLEKSKHKAYTKSLLCSGDEKQIEAALEAMKRLVLKWDASSAIAKMNQQAYAAREQEKLRAKSDPKIRAWERECRRNPYYPDQESIERMKEREEEKLMERVRAYHEKWHSHPCTVQEPHMRKDGYMVVAMPEGWTRKEETL